ncbi:lipocalin family protein [Kriegella aquimaris]|uniref:Lipocalin-like domain-containing protein n=1 Tax=Kriegella aquimaris TaxID=192904 RepID=A0A1G9IF87_9FLAO|nr:lipocalin family protein [Kriegella aquimaris]SDL23792.1 Lipocalin-like domain-containing protein [Kriegella aquimaris]
MKRHFLIFMALAMVAASCSVSKSAREKRSLLDGTWTLEDVSYENNTGNFKSVIFNDAEDICFEGSDWFFRNNNSTGRYTIAPSTYCNGGDRYIRWSVVDSDKNYTSQLQFKFIDAKSKDISGGLGYRLNIVSLTPQAMTLKSNNTVDGETVTVVYEFTKKQ